MANTRYKTTNKKKNLPSQAPTATRGHTRKQVVPTGATGEAPVRPAGTRKTGPKRATRKDITLPPTVVDAVAEHAKALNISQTEYHRLAVSAYFKECLVNPPPPLVTTCPTCGKKTREAEKQSGFHRERVGVRFDTPTATMLVSLADDYYVGTWSRAFEAAMRFYLGDRNPPPEGWGRVPGVKLPGGRKPGTSAREQKRLARIQAQEAAVANKVAEALAAAEAAGKGGS